VIDEASMMTSPDLADLITLAESQGGKLIVAGDTSQLQAVQNGGGMLLLADRLGYARPAEPVRFREPWEQAASLRLRDGDTTALADYDQHARITGEEPEQVMDAAAAATIEGTDKLLMTAAESAPDHELELE
jgi:ATP-dependent exoDNAse (exonuclease V) alpha subunit